MESVRPKLDLIVFISGPNDAHVVPVGVLETLVHLIQLDDAHVLERPEIKNIKLVGSIGQMFIMYQARRYSRCSRRSLEPVAPELDLIVLISRPEDAHDVLAAIWSP